MHSSNLIILFVVCLLCVGTGWAEPTLAESTSVSSRLPTSSSLSESSTGSGASSPEPLKTEGQVPTPATETITDTKTITSTSGAATSASSRSHISTDDSTLSSSILSEKTSTRTIIRASSVPLTTVPSTTKSDSNVVTSTSQNNTSTTTTLSNFTTNTSSSATPTSLSTTTRTNSTFPETTSPPSNTTSTTNAGVQHQPGHCLIGSDCAWKLGVGLSFGGTFVLAGLFFVSRRYRRHLVASHREHQANWNNRGHVLDEYGYLQDRHEAMKMIDTPDTRATSPRDGRFDELYLPVDMQRAVNRIAELQRQETRLPVESYGSVRRKPLPART